IAGDLLPDRTNPDLVATKFHLQTQYNLEGGVDAEEDRTKRVIDQINTVGTTWLGTTVGCAQCHDHPYDEFTQRDFFSLYAFFNNTDYAADFLTDPPVDADSKRSDRANRWSKVAANLEKQVTDKNLSNAVQGALSGMRGFDNSNHFTRYLEERTVNRRTTHIFQRGDFLQPDLASHVQPAAPTALPAMTARGDTPDRLDLSNWITSPENPLTARVTVNKIWARLFGRPLADQPHDFGARGTPPSHPGLLDHLAHYFVHDALWSRKKLIRYIVTSQAYQRSSHHRPDLADIDPDNALLARQNPFRAEAEVIRDIALQSAGLLHHGIGGPSVYPPLPAIIAAQTYAGSFKYKPSTGPDRYRRGLYTFFRRTAIDPNLSTFDCPDSSSSQPLRDTSNNPLQALATLQNEVFHEAAQSFAKSLLAKHPNRPRRLLHTAYLTALSRPPSKQESKTLLALYKKSHAHYTAHPEAAAQLVGPHASPLAAPETNAAWIATLRVVLNLDEFLTRS
ncbi:MAG: DUF1553 domain-containing protein, partial [Verrucomicrobiales bacterium]|nr:DUF1553 domain-containing protein [Verrucomicrobiales bacterium]